MKTFSEKGTAFSMDEIADLAGVSKQAIYRRWPSKIDLVIEAIESVLSDELDQATETHDDPVMAMKELAWRHFGSDHTASNRLNIYLQVESFGNDHLRERLVEWRNRFTKVYKQALGEVGAAGRRAAGDIEVQSELLMELLSGGAQKLALTGLVAPPDQRNCFDQRWEAFKRIAIC